jgi:nitrous oxidase accessory protein NosD
MPASDQKGEWSGLFVDHGELSLAWCRVTGAESGLTLLKEGRATLSHVTFSKNRYGISVMDPSSRLTIADSRLSDNDYGLLLANGAEAAPLNCEFAGNRQQDIFKPRTAKYLPAAKVYTTGEKEKTTTYTSESLLSTVVWQDRVVINGVVRVPAMSRLIIMPGTVIEFSKSDTNNDQIGENGLLVMGMLIAKGTAEKVKGMADWDAINLYNSDGFQNLLEYCQIENAYRGVHMHFSNAAVAHSVFRDNYRGLQFQESLVELRDNDIFANKNAMRGRDTELLFTGNRIHDNYFGPNFFRITGAVRDNIMANNLMDGLRVREGALDVEDNYLLGNRYGLTIAYANYGKFNRNVLVANQEMGLVLKGADNLEVGDNFIQGNGGNGISLLQSRATITGNQITHNGERGIGIISFAGAITGNNLAANRLYAIGLDGAMAVNATGNWWGGEEIPRVIFDRQDDPQNGLVDYGGALAGPVVFTWPRGDLLADTVWLGEINIPQRVTTVVGSKLQIMPGTTVKFAKDRGLWARGDIEALGEPGRRIRFTALEKTAGVYWHQIMTDLGSGVFSYCDFEYGGMAIHSHFANIQVSHCLFRNNESGIRFRGGPVEISDSVFVDNVYGLVSYLAKGKVLNNLFTNNETGILVRGERKGGMTIKHNNLIDNRRYNLRMGDFNDRVDVEASENWWGQVGPAGTIFDQRQEPDIGFVKFTPAATVPYKLDIEAFYPGGN